LTLLTVASYATRFPHIPHVSQTSEKRVALLLFWTEFNPSTPAPTARRAQAQIPGSQYVELKDCAHWPQWEDPEAFNNAVRSFMNAR
jgi:2-hydroxy-6-oxonona-2,4-dienedioate hydrolase